MIIISFILNIYSIYLSENKTYFNFWDFSLEDWGVVWEREQDVQTANKEKQVNLILLSWS